MHSLITITIIVIAISVTIPPTSGDDIDMITNGRNVCNNFLIYYCGFQNNAKDYEISILNKTIDNQTAYHFKKTIDVVLRNQIGLLLDGEQVALAQIEKEKVNMNILLEMKETEIANKRKDIIDKEKKIEKWQQEVQNKEKRIEKNLRDLENLQKTEDLPEYLQKTEDLQKKIKEIIDLQNELEIWQVKKIFKIKKLWQEKQKLKKKQQELEKQLDQLKKEQLWQEEQKKLWQEQLKKGQQRQGHNIDIVKTAQEKKFIFERQLEVLEQEYLLEKLNMNQIEERLKELRKIDELKQIVESADSTKMINHLGNEYIGFIKKSPQDEPVKHFCENMVTKKDFKSFFESILNLTTILSDSDIDI